jgi:hypothetical protein
MKNGFIVFVLTVFLVSCGKKKENTPTKNVASIKTNINLLLNNWHKAAADANYEAYFGKMDSIAVFIGTDATENWTKTQFAAFSKPYFNKGKAWSFKAIERNIYLSKNKNFVWFDELLDTWMGTCRGSGVLEKINNSWKIKQYVLSVSIPNDDIVTVIDVKKENDSIFKINFNK